MKTVGGRLRSARGSLSREEAGARLGIHPNTLARYESDEREAPRTVLEKAANAYGVALSWLKAGDGQPASAREDARAFDSPHSSERDDDQVMIPVLDIRASAGTGQPVESELSVGTMTFDRTSLIAHGVNPKGARLVQGQGDSMYPTIQDGDPLLIDITDRETRDKVFVIRRGSELLIKRLQKHSDGSVSLLSDNPTYAPERLPRDEADELEVIGRVAVVLRSI